MNPYYDQTFFSFFLVFFKRLFLFLTGQLNSLASDEVQLLVLAAVSASCALVGTFLLLRKMILLANALSHTILLGIVIAFVTFNTPAMLLLAAVLMGLLTTFLTLKLTETIKVQVDASIGIVFTSLFALGVLFVTLLTKNSHMGIEAVMGNVDALTSADIPFVLAILAFNILLFTCFFKGYAITTFDPEYARVLGVSVMGFNYLLMAQVSLTAIGAFRAVGVLMVLALITVPPLTARRWTHRLKPLLGVAVFIGCLASFIGVAIARHLLTAYGIALSTSGIVVCVTFLLFALTILLKELRLFKTA